VNVPVWLPSLTKSSTAEAVTVCGTFQFALVKVYTSGAPLTWLSGETVTSTLAVGCELSASV